MWFTFGLFWKTTFLLFSSLVSCLTARMLVSYAIQTLPTRTGFLWYKLSGLNMKENTHIQKNSYKCSDYFSLSISLWNP